LVALLVQTARPASDPRAGATQPAVPAIDVDAALLSLGFARGSAEQRSFFGLATPARLVDTRAGVGGSRLGAGETLTVTVTGVPSSAAALGAASLNVTAVGAAAPGYLSVYPCGQPTPVVSSVNYVTAVPVANKVLAAVPPDGRVCIFSMSSTDVVVDLDGWLAPIAPFHAVTPQRLLDTRPAGAKVTDATVTAAPPGATGAIVNVTVTEPTAAGFATVYPCGALPLASTLNFVAGATVPGAALAPVDASGHLCVHTSSPAHVVVDVAGWLGSGFAPLNPTRLLDTRSQGARVTDVMLPGTNGAAGLALSLTITAPAAAGYATVYPCGQAPPLVSNINFVAGQTVANAVVATPDPLGRVCVHALVPAHIVVDLSGTLT
jgi:hypothetical protein